MLNFIDRLLLVLTRGTESPYLIEMPVLMYNTLLKEIKDAYGFEEPLGDLIYKGCLIHIHPENNFSVKIKKDD